MTLFKNRISAYEEARANLLSGNINCIPIKPYLPKLSTVLPGLKRGTYYCITSFTNVGKTPLAKYLFGLIPMDYYLKGYNIRILYFALEESNESFMDSLIVSKLQNSGVNVSSNMLNSIEFPVSEGIIKKVQSLEKHFEKVERCITIISDLMTPEDIYKYIIREANKRGKFENDRYIPNDKNEFVIVVVDHINLLQSGDRRLRIEEHSNNMLEVTKKFNYIVCNVQQQSAEGENEKYAKFNGNEPSLTTLGDNKAVQRDYHIVISLSMPQRNGVVEHNNIKLNTDELRKFYRGIRILKNRHGGLIQSGWQIEPEKLNFKEL